MSDLQDYIDKGLIKFAEDSDIFIEVCHVGSTGTFAPRLADITGCSVIDACGSSSGYEIGPDFITFKSGPENTAEKLDGELDGWLIFFPSQ